VSVFLVLEGKSGRLDLISKVVLVEDPNVTPGHLVVFLAQPPADTFRTVPGNAHGQISLGLQDSIDFFESCFVIGYMLENLRADHRVKLIRAKGEVERVPLTEAPIFFFDFSQFPESLSGLPQSLEVQINSDNVDHARPVDGVHVSPLSASQIQDPVPRRKVQLINVNGLHDE
jgi:hypothetical protein